MQIREDFRSVEMLLTKLVQFASAFDENNMEHWGHLKNNEDYENIYDLPWEQRSPLEDIYGDGRDLAGFMSLRLLEFNYPARYPTLKKFVDSFDNGSISEIDGLKSASQKAKDICSSLQRSPWSVRQMIRLFDRQIELLEDVRSTIEGLKISDIYKWESGNAQPTYPIPSYSTILECIHSVGKMFERLPSTYSGKDEESLRDHILVTLQGLVSGSATGEAFNKRGKTDILVRNGSVNEFVGECKCWRGESAYIDAIDQLLSYLSWRDTKTAIILFVPNKDFGAVISQVDGITSKHKNYVQKTCVKDETWRCFEFRMIEDESQIVELAVMLYHTPKIS